MKANAPLLILEPWVSGHHGVYLQWIAREAVARGYSVIIGTSTSTLDHPMIKAIRSEFPAIEIMALETPAALERPAKSFLSLLRRDWTYRRFLARMFKTVKLEPAFVLVPYLDYCLYTLALFGPPFGQSRWGGIVMRPSFHLRKMGLKAPLLALSSIREYLFRRLLKSNTLAFIASIDPSLPLYLNGSLAPSQTQITYLPDPATINTRISHEDARFTLGVPESVFLVVAFGALTGRKGIRWLLEAAVDPSFPTDVAILFAGEQDDETAKMIGSFLATHPSVRPSVFQKKGFLNETDERSVFSAADAVWVGYEGHYGMSGVLAQAGILGIPVIACEDGLIGWATTQAKSGLTIVPKDTRQVIAAIQILARDQVARRYYSENASRVYHSHTISNAARSLFEAMP